ncbi:undecaprenyl/decaprenyl-phosphate alpha-N-acetylglucosaminyl 1-phosphate transferase [Candidatus Chlorohelix allophototropha]|uniref:Undecaprenyl/decaprenyl-phosphate alpha-N-acetylglucosaminyl 1-phosphate transferase n=2 Tax=Candidatus Chlorohelix allophototropha TaxID=3003348 RepID=A0ABY9B3Q4_9CHLR|nr:undecaprenyl/decaprenyl-phosphate alpha-N-acetylglucosaminyl 1-phosphate transferase [Chloroflexota bacterium L227-S17]
MIYQQATIQSAPENPGMGFYLALFVGALLLALLITPLVRRIALKSGIVDAPGLRKIHSSPVPLLGGVAIYLAFTLALLGLTGWILPFYFLQLAAILFGATLMSITGFLDDKYGLPPLVKLLAQLGVGLWLIISGVQIEVFRVSVLNVLITLLWVVAITNAMNFLDNMDGLSGGVSVIAAAFFFLSAYQSGQWLVGALGATLAGAGAGFVYHNFGIFSQKSPHQIFMGDSGSLFMGFLLAACGIKLRFPNTDFVTWMVPVLVLGVPLFDITLVTLSRLRRSLPIARGGKDHTSHRLVALGLSSREAVLILWMASGALGVAALVIMGASVRDGYVVGGVVAVLAGWAVLRLEHVPLVNTNPAVKGSGKGLKNNAETTKPEIK